MATAIATRCSVGVASGELRAPRQVVRAIPPDLETIVLTATAGDASDRYRTARELADDLSRYLENKPLLAKRAPAWRRAVKWSRRHPSLMSAVVAGLLATVVALSVGMVLVGRAYRSEAEHRRTAEDARRLADEQKIRADANLKLARDTIYRAYRKQAEDLKGEPQMTTAQEAFLLEVVQFYDGLPKSEIGAEEVRSETASAYALIGRVRRKLGQNEVAIEAFARAVSLRQELAAEFPSNSTYRDDLTATQESLAWSLRSVGRHEDALDAFRNVLRRREKLVEQQPDTPQHIEPLVEAHVAVGIVYEDIEKHRAAEKAFREALTVAQRLVRDFPDSLQNDHVHAEALAHLATFLDNRRRTDEAIPLFLQAVEIGKSVLDRAADSLEYRDALAGAYNNLGGALEKRQQDEQAADALAEAQRLYTSLCDDYPDRPKYRRWLARVYMNRADLTRSEEDFAQAIALLKRLVREFPGTVEYQADLAVSLYNRAKLLETTGRKEDAAADLRRCIPRLEKLVPLAPDVAKYQKYLAKAYYNLGMMLVQADPAEAQKAWRRSAGNWRDLSAAYPAVSEYHSRVGATLSNLAILVRNAGELDEACELLEQAIGHQRDALKCDKPFRFASEFLHNHYLVLSRTLIKQGKHTEAAAVIDRLDREFSDHMRAAELLAKCALLAGDDEALSNSQRETARRDYLQRAADALDKAKQNAPEDPVAQNALAWILVSLPFAELHDLARAVQLAEQAVKSKPTHAGYRNTLGVALYRAGKWREANTALEESIRIKEAAKGSPDVSNWLFLAMAHHRLGESDKARRWMDKATAWIDANKPDDEQLRRFRAEATKLLAEE